MNGMRELKVYVGPGLDSEGIKNALNSRDDDGQESYLMFEVAHALMDGHKDDRAEIHSVSVDEVTVDPAYPSQVHLEFTTFWSAYFGCKDMNTADDKFESETSTYTKEGDLVFIVPAARRPANDC
jgi:hypothetical protein